MQLCKAVKTQSFTQDIFLSKSHPSPVLKKKKNKKQNHNQTNKPRKQPRSAIKPVNKQQEENVFEDSLCEVIHATVKYLCSQTAQLGGVFN